MTQMRMLRMPKAGYVVLADTLPKRGKRTLYQFLLWSKIANSPLEVVGAAPSRYNSELIEEQLGLYLIRDPLTTSFVGKQKAEAIFKWLSTSTGKNWLTMYGAEIDVATIRIQKVEFYATEARYRSGILRRHA